MLILILTNMLAMAFVIKPSLAGSSKNGVVGSASAQTSSQASVYGGNGWNFNDTSLWSNFTYRDGNNTRLVVGVDPGNPASLVELEKIVAERFRILPWPSQVEPKRRF